MSKRTQGFTLLELSIVLVIIGLLIGGIFVGQSLIHTAQLNAVISELNRYQTATQNFRQQYQALPGDMSNATSFWGIAGGTGSDATCQTTSSSTALTCNGNGDGSIFTSTGSLEYYRFWQHLANAKMIEGSYTGIGTNATPTTGTTGGVNVPASKYGNGGWTVYPATFLTAGNTDNFATDYGTGHVFLIGMPDSTRAVTDGVLLTPKDAWTIDKKADDGMPGEGNIILKYWSPCSNAGAKTNLAATYTLSSTTVACDIFFISSF